MHPEFFRVIFFLLMVFSFTKGNSQTYSSNDSLILLNINSSCDVNDNLNWEHEANPSLWWGVQWNNDNPKKVNYLWLEDYELQDTLDLRGLSELGTFSCNLNHIQSLKISGLGKLVCLRASSNQIQEIEMAG
jgi:hypothetical protein